MRRLVIGTMLGAVVGVLFAPRPGSDMRADLRNRTDPLRARARELGQNAADRYGHTVRSGIEPVTRRLSSRFRHLPPVSSPVRETEGAEATAL